MQDWLMTAGHWLGLLRLPLIAYSVLAGYAYFFADRQIFLPYLARNADLAVAPLQLQTQDGATIAALHLTHASARYTLLYSHGNAETLGDIYPRLQRIRDLGFNVLAYDYRGYGQSLGTPSEQAAYRDIEAAYGYLTQTLQVLPGQILVLGRSVGGGPSTYLAEHHPVGG
jgi:pimeloyl-ACP methyl ester carboxylesterase